MAGRELELALHLRGIRARVGVNNLDQLGDGEPLVELDQREADFVRRRSARNGFVRAFRDGGDTATEREVDRHEDFAGGRGEAGVLGLGHPAELLDRVVDAVIETALNLAPDFVNGR